MDYKLESGAKLSVTQSSYEDAIDLNDELLKSFGEISLTDDIVNKIKTAASSPVVRRCIMKCAERAVYENVRVSKELFDDPKLGVQARKDYFEICFRIVEVNCYPFLEGLLSLLKTGKLTSINAPA